MRVMRRRAMMAIVGLVVVAAAAFAARPFVHGLSFVIRAADMPGRIRHAADLDTRPIEERDIAIPTARGSMRGRMYAPTGSYRRTSLLVSGPHPSGIAEPRLVRLARQLSASGVAVVTPDIPELSQFEITPAITDAIEQGAGWLATQSGMASDHRVGMMGISFAGGLSIVAAGRAALSERVSYVFSLGGHDDLPRVLRYLCTGAAPVPHQPVRLAQDTADTQFTRPPHDDGVAVIALGAADRLVPAAQVAPFRAAVRRYLLASALDSDADKAAAASEFERLRADEKTFPEPSATLLRYVNTRDVVHLGARLLPFITQFGGDPALSVSKAPKPSAPVFLLHGVDDNVIPPIESQYLAEDLRGRAPVRLLLSGLVSRAGADRPVRVEDVLPLAGFWGDLLSR
jgi:dienelactone hydrolase